MMNISVKRLTDTATIPTRGTEYSAGLDLYADIENEITIMPHCAEVFPTGIAMAIPDGYYGGVYVRSSLGFKKGLRLSNSTGIIDSDYRGGIQVKLYNDSNEKRIIQPQERIAQLIIQPYEKVNLVEANELPETARGEGGFGSTGSL